MKLDKENWVEYQMSDLVSHLSSSEKDPSKRDELLNLGVEHLKSLDLRITEPSSDHKTTFTKKFKSGDILFARRAAYLKKVGIAHFDGICSGDLMVLHTKGQLDQRLLAFMMQRDSFFDFVLSNSAGSLSLRIKWSSLSKYKIKLPPKDEQKQILDLFETLENQINKCEEQINRLHISKMRIQNEVLNSDSISLKLNRIKWKKITFGQLVDHIEVNERDPNKRLNNNYVGVEHIKTLDLRIKGKFDEEMPTYFRTFKKGQVLFAKRRAYQKKVAIADFDGICSPHIWALQTKSNELLQDFLPFIMQTDIFYEYVNANSAGTMSTYLKWDALSNYAFYLPPHEIQKKIVSLLTNFNDQIYLLEDQHKLLRKLKMHLLTQFFD